MNPDNLSPAEINAAIATLCGAYDIEIGRASWREPIPDNLEGVIWHEDGLIRARIPNYHGSLDAMHEAEATLTNEEWESYADDLLWTGESEGYSNYTACRRGCQAKANERALAFLRVKKGTPE